MENNVKNLFGTSILHKKQGRYGKTAEKVNEIHPYIATPDEILESMSLLNKLDREHGWFAYEFCTSMVLQNFMEECSNPTFSESLFNVKSQFRDAWNTEMVAFWYPSNQWDGRYRGLFDYAYIRLSKSTLPSDIERVHANRLFKVMNNILENEFLKSPK